MLNALNDRLLMLLADRRFLRGALIAITSVPSAVILIGATRARGWTGFLTISVVYVIVGVPTALWAHSRLAPTEPTQPVIVGAEYPSPWVRLGAHLIDWLSLLIVAWIPAAMISAALDSNRSFYESRDIIEGLYFLAGNCLGVTIGKHVFRIRVVRLDASSPGLSHGVPRSIPSLISIWIALALAAVTCPRSLYHS
jgi:uncharacterized RDD family membrane protein YckC